MTVSGQQNEKIELQPRPQPHLESSISISVVEQQPDVAPMQSVVDQKPDAALMKSVVVPHRSEMRESVSESSAYYQSELDESYSYNPRV